MKNIFKESNKGKHQFRSYYCADCRQIKPCGTLTGWNEEYKSYCCQCYYQSQQERSKNPEYSSYETVYQQKLKGRQEYTQQLQLLKRYSGCSQCKSQEADAYSLYENSVLVCWTCLIKKAGVASSPISFSEQSKWYKKRWGINLGEWLDNYRCLPVNANCAREWLKDKEHLNNCACLEKEAEENYELFSNSLKEIEKKLKKCFCEKSEKPRAPYYDSANYGYTYCEKCEAEIKGAGKMGVIKNRNNPNFWGLKVKEKVLCLNCLAKFQAKMSI